MKKLLLNYLSNYIYPYIIIGCIISLQLGGYYCEYNSKTIYWPIYILTPILVFIFSSILQIVAIIIKKINEK